MASRHWVKLYHEILDDPTTGRLGHRDWWLFIQFMLVVAENNGKAVSTGALAERLCGLPEVLESRMEYFASQGLIEGSHRGWTPIERGRYYCLSSKQHSRREWRLDVLERDNWLCQDCGRPAGEVDLHAHHIKPWFLHKNGRYDIKNGITLCEDCHRKRHEIGWKQRSIVTGRA